MQNLTATLIQITVVIREIAKTQGEVQVVEAVQEAVAVQVAEVLQEVEAAQVQAVYLQRPQHLLLCQVML